MADILVVVIGSDAGVLSQPQQHRPLRHALLVGARSGVQGRGGEVGGRQLVRLVQRGRSLDLRPEIGQPLAQGSVVTLLILVVAQPAWEEARGAELGELLVDHLGGLVEEAVGGVAQPEDAVVEVLQDGVVQGGVRHRRPEVLGVLGELTLPGGRADDEDEFELGELVDLHLVQLTHLHLVTAALQQSAYTLGDFFGVARLRSEEDVESPRARLDAAGGESLLKCLEGGVELGRVDAARGLRSALHAVETFLGELGHVLLQLGGYFGLGAHERGETVLPLHELSDVDFEFLGVELQGVLSLVLQLGVVSVQQPVARLDGDLDVVGLVRPCADEVTVLAAGGVAHDQRGTLVRLGLHKRPDHLAVVGAQRA
mmetsp:Transcript_31602/g.78276  ORF Transcript_31602/g.78276 Transcript_31602/m.78276 type:complete len:370 (-) Transcript_31602:3283-4392(-)